MVNCWPNWKRTFNFFSTSSKELLKDFKKRIGKFKTFVMKINLTVMLEKDVSMPLCLCSFLYRCCDYCAVLTYSSVRLEKAIIASETGFCTSCILYLFPFCLVFFKAFENFHLALICKFDLPLQWCWWVCQSKNRELSSLGLVWWFSILTSHSNLSYRVFESPQIN